MRKNKEEDEEKVVEEELRKGEIGGEGEGDGRERRKSSRRGEVMYWSLH